VSLADGTKAKVRILGIDTPETVDPRKTVQCFGKEASVRMKELVQGKTIVLIKDPAQDKDVYGRLLRYIDLNGVDIGAQMIAEGYAYSYKKYPQPRLEEYNKLEVQAREAGKGLWGSCPLRP
jgi:micrococcal nuclease